MLALCFEGLVFLILTIGALVLAVGFHKVFKDLAKKERQFRKEHPDFAKHPDEDAKNNQPRYIAMMFW